jgi:membrane associated rhomboid family serine protease
LTARVTTRQASFGRRRAPAAKPRPAPAPDAPPRPVAPAARPGFFARLPWFTAALAAGLVLLFRREVMLATDFSAPLAPGHFSLLALGASDRAQVLGQGEWWRLFTASALHGSIAHLAGNLVALVVAGCLLEPMIGIGWFAAVYFSGALAGTVLSMLVNPAALLSVGASGAIMALLAALFALSFHAGAWRPGLMRRIAGGLLFPALLPSVSGGAVTDIHAHLGGMMAGTALAFVLLWSWNEEDAAPPGRSLAAALAGMLLAATVWAFVTSWSGFAQYARSGRDYIPPARMPASEAAMARDSLALVEAYPRDPRAHLFRGLALLQKNNLSDAEPHLRAAIALATAAPGVMTPDFLVWTKALLALDLAVRGRGHEARQIAAPLCGAKDARARQVLAIGKLCQ